MQIYTGNADGKHLDKVKELGLGIMIASSPNRMPSKQYADVPCALDNGAFQCWRKGYPFMEQVFLKTLDRCYAYNLSLDFIVCPDLVTRGYESLLFSMRYAAEKLNGAPRLALAVQDGMTPTGVHNYTADQGFSHIFVGGSVEWKWQTAQDWVRFAHDHGLKCHVGRCGTLPKLDKAFAMGVDSVDSVNFVRNETWDVVRQFHKGDTHPLFIEE